MEFMKEFTYSFFAKVIYRYANIPLTVLLGIYIFFSAVGFMNDWVYIFPLLLNIILVYVVNRYYFKMYRLFPYNIKADNEKIICSGFINKNKVIEITLLDIDNITGGIFSGSPVKPIYLHDTKNNITVGFNHHLKDFNKLLTIILSNIKQELYTELLDRVKEHSIVNRLQRKKGKKYVR